MNTTPQQFKSVAPWVGLMTMLFFFNYSGRSLLGPLLLPISAEFNLSNETVLSLPLYLSVGFSIGTLCSGFLLSKLTARTVVMCAIGGSGISYMLMPLTTAFWQVQVLVGAYGLIVGFYFTSSMSVLHSLVDMKNLGKAVGVHELAPSLAFIFIPLYTSVALRFLDWRECFALCGGAALLATALFAAIGKGGRERSPAPSFAGLADIVLSPGTWVFMAWFGLACAGEFASYSVAPLYLVDDLGCGEQSANFLLSSSRLIMPLCVLFGGYLADKYPCRRIVSGYLVLHGAALLIMAVPTLPTVIFGFAVQSALTAMIFPALLRLFADMFPADLYSLTLGISMPVATFLANGLIPRLLGWAGDNFSFSAGFAVFGVLYIASLLLFRVPLRRSAGGNI